MNGRVEYGEGASVARTVPGTVTAARKPRLSVRSGVVAERGKNGAEAEIRTPDLLITNQNPSYPGVFNRVRIPPIYP